MEYAFTIYCPVCRMPRTVASNTQEERRLQFAMILLDPSLQECYECWPSQEAKRYCEQKREHEEIMRTFSSEH